MQGRWWLLCVCVCLCVCVWGGVCVCMWLLGTSCVLQCAISYFFYSALNWCIYIYIYCSLYVIRKMKDRCKSWNCNLMLFWMYFWLSTIMVVLNFIFFHIGLQSQRALLKFLEYTFFELILVISCEGSHKKGCLCMQKF